MLKKILSISLFVALGAMLACSPGTLRLTVQFDATEGIKVADSVIFEQNHIGTVKSIRYTAEGHYLVAIAVQNEFKHALTVDSVFYIDSDPMDPRRKALIVELPTAGGALLADGSLVMGAPKPSSWQQMFDTLRGKANDWQKELDRTVDELKEDYGDKSAQIEREMQIAIQEASRRLEELQQAIKEASNSKEVKELQQAVQNLFAELQQRLAEIELSGEGRDGQEGDRQ
jgi:paraquat-inducible protein B